ncbi:50S ribosomal protein L20 [Candidatus Omnitrophota bacterium]
MPRARNNPASRHRRKKILKRARGFQGGRSKLIRTASESIKRAMASSYRDRRTKKRVMRRLWILRIGAACKANELSYSKFIRLLSLAKVEIDRKMLADIAVHDKEGFTKIVEFAKSKAA